MEKDIKEALKIVLIALELPFSLSLLYKEEEIKDQSSGAVSAD
jgi:hypothetical protein